jgi:hypothetical protein
MFPHPYIVIQFSSIISLIQDVLIYDISVKQEQDAEQSDGGRMTLNIPNQGNSLILREAMNRRLLLLESS